MINHFYGAIKHYFCITIQSYGALKRNQGVRVIYQLTQIWS